jgi:hypothetical protein
MLRDRPDLLARVPADLYGRAVGLFDELQTIC